VKAVSLEEYLHSSFPGIDREYRDDTLVERSTPDYLHGKTQALLIALFMALRKSCRCTHAPKRESGSGRAAF
jgi:hypothetical protein